MKKYQEYLNKFHPFISGSGKSISIYICFGCFLSHIGKKCITLFIWATIWFVFLYTSPWVISNLPHIICNIPSKTFGILFKPGNHKALYLSVGPYIYILDFFLPFEHLRVKRGTWSGGERKAHSDGNYFLHPIISNMPALWYGMTL